MARGGVQVFKVKALLGLRAVFPSDVNPLYASFGSSPSDMEAYRQASIYTIYNIFFLFFFMSGVLACCMATWRPTWKVEGVR